MVSSALTRYSFWPALLPLAAACGEPAAPARSDATGGAAASGAVGGSAASPAGTGAAPGTGGLPATGGSVATGAVPSGGAPAGGQSTLGGTGGASGSGGEALGGSGAAVAGGAGGSAGLGSGGMGSLAAGGSGGLGGSSGGVGTGGVAGSSSTGGIAGAASGGAGGSGGITGGAGGSTNTGGDASGGAPADGTLSDLQIEPNPRNVLSCFVTWTTAAPADSVVQFGSGALEWEIADSSPVTDHRVLVIGMHANQTYQIVARSSDGSGTASAEGTFTTGSLPASVPVATVTVADPARMQAGWTLMNIQKGDGTPSARSNDPSMAVMYDAEGQPVWYYINGTSVDRGGAVSVDLTDVGVLIGPSTDANLQNVEAPKEVDFAGEIRWQCATPSCSGTGGNLSHHAGKLSNGNYVVQRDVTVGSGTAPRYEEITPDNQVVWTWEWQSFVDTPAGASGDFCHGNSITIDLEANTVYANCRWMGLVKTTYQNPTFQWHLPASYGASGLGNMAFSPTTSQFSDTHDPEIHDDGTILFYENGGFSGTIEEGNPRGYHSRALEYQIDEANHTATLVWEFPGSFDVDPWYRNDWYIPFWGDADRLANGNVLVTAGVRGPNSQSRIFEVTKADGVVVWEFRLPNDYGVYRSERITPPLVRPLTQ